MYHSEKLNSISHLLGTVFALIGLGALLTVSLIIGTAPIIIGFTVFGVSMALLYTVSTLYHSTREPTLKRKLKTLDHISIYIFIAGSYTPFMLVSLGSASGTVILISIWVLALVGILAELFLSGRIVKTIQLFMYLGMGWLCAIDLENIRAALTEQGFFWLLSGGIAYTVGIAFYVIDKLNWLNHAHGIWHMFVLFGSICHFIAVIGFVR